MEVCELLMLRLLYLYYGFTTTEISLARALLLRFGDFAAVCEATSSHMLRVLPSPVFREGHDHCHARCSFLSELSWEQKLSRKLYRNVSKAWRTTGSPVLQEPTRDCGAPRACTCPRCSTRGAPKV